MAGSGRSVPPTRDVVGLASHGVPMNAAASEPGRDLHTRYYAQRASAGLIITEGTLISREAVGWHDVPGLFTDAHGLVDLVADGETRPSPTPTYRHTSPPWHRSDAPIGPCTIIPPVLAAIPTIPPYRP
jgi:hypothetical protein